MSRILQFGQWAGRAKLRGAPQATQNSARSEKTPPHSPHNWRAGRPHCEQYATFAGSGAPHVQNPMGALSPVGIDRPIRSPSHYIENGMREARDRFRRAGLPNSHSGFRRPFPAGLAA
jgi:hypothetical protein